MRFGDTFIKAVSSCKLMIYRIIVKENILYQAPDGRHAPLDWKYICTNEDTQCFDQYNNNHNFYRDLTFYLDDLCLNRMFFKHV